MAEVDRLWGEADEVVDRCTTPEAGRACTAAVAVLEGVCIIVEAGAVGVEAVKEAVREATFETKLPETEDLSAIISIAEAGEEARLVVINTTKIILRSVGAVLVQWVSIMVEADVTIIFKAEVLCPRPRAQIWRIGEP